MKRACHTLFASLIFAFVAMIPRTGSSQCDVYWHQYPYFCDLDSVLVTATPLSGVAPFTYIWSTGATTQSIIVPNQIGDYIVTMTDATGCTATVLAHIKFLANVVNYPFTNFACEGDAVLLFMDWVREDLPGLQFLWSTGETTSQILVYENTTWQVTVTDPATGCQFVSEPQVLEFDERPDVEIIGPAEMCEGQIATLSLEGGPFEFIDWHPANSFEETLEIDGPGLYWVYVENGIPTCPGLDTIIITEVDMPDPLLAGPPELCGGQTGTVNVTNSNLFEEFLWHNGETGSSIEINGPGTFTVTVTADNGCSRSVSMTVDNGSQMVLSSNATSSTCGESNGIIDLSVSGSSGYSYDWSNGETSQDIQDIPTGAYTVTVTSGDGCTATLETIVLNTNPPITINEIITSNTSCTSSNGAINITLSPVETYSYQWSNGQTTEDISNLAPGTYTITATLGMTCTASETFTVPDNSDSPDLTALNTNPTCGEVNGEIDLQVTGGNAPFTFTWSNGALTEDLQNLGPGSYYVTVTANDGCIANLSTDVINQNIPITIDEIITPNNACSDFNGAIDLMVSPIETYSYQWSSGQSTEDIAGLSPGSYSVTVTHGLTCIATDTFLVDDISAAPDLSATTIPASCGEANGEIDLSLTGGNGPFIFEWSNGSGMEDLQGLNIGVYSITVTASDGCSSTLTVELAENNPTLIISGQIEPNTSCDESNGAIDISVLPVNDDYSFEWSNGQVTEDMIGVGSGDYIVTVSLGSCIWSESFTVTNQNLPFSVSGNTLPNTSCSVPNGSIDLSVSPAGNYIFEWDGGGISEDLSGLDEGSYTVTVIDNSGCSITSYFIVEALNSSFNVSGFSVANTSCQVPNGIIDITASPAGNYIFDWSNGADTEDLQELSAGSYAVTITNSDGCTVDTFFIVENQSAAFVLGASSSPDTSCLGESGSLDLSVIPSGNYSFTWSNGAISEDLDDLSSGEYYVTVSDDLTSCATIDTFHVTSQLNLPEINAVLTDETCGKVNGSIDLTILPAASVIQWSNGGTSEDIANLASGSYSVTVTAANGCFIADTFVIQSTSNTFSISAQPSDNTSCADSNGSLDLSVSPAGTYSYAWSTGDFVEDIFNLNAGTYTVTVTDDQNCSSSSSFLIQDNTVDPLIEAMISPATCGLQNGSIEIALIPSAGNTFLWSNGAQFQNLQNLSPGQYSLTVTSANSCTAQVNFIVPDLSSNLQISGTTNAITSCLEANGAIDITVNPLGNNYLYQWSTGDVSQDLVALDSGSYLVTVTDKFGCTFSKEFVVDENLVYPELNSTISPATCGKPNGSIDITINITNNNTILWSDGSDMEDLTNILPGQYSVLITSGKGCSTSGEFEVPNINSSFYIEVVIENDSSCTNPNGSIDLAITPSGSYLFTWSNGEVSEDLLQIASGIYSVTVTDQHECSSFETYTIENIIELPSINAVIEAAHCGFIQGGIDLTVIPGSATNTFSWSTGDVSEDLFEVSEGIYSVTITNGNSCAIQGEFIVPGSPSIEVELDADLSTVPVGGIIRCDLEVNVPIAALDSIRWSPHQIMSCNDVLCFQQTIELTEDFDISVLVIDTNGCKGEAFLSLRVAEDFSVYVPNVFTPGRDGENSFFTIYAKDIDEIEELEIFDRWGNCVFISERFPPNEPGLGWDGHFKGTTMNPGVYAFRAIVRDLNGKQHQLKGDVTLIR